MPSKMLRYKEFERTGKFYERKLEVVALATSPKTPKKRTLMVERLRGEQTGDTRRKPPI